MNICKTAFAQIMQLDPRYDFNECVHRYQGNQGMRSFPC
jgi:hypothetical protein